MHTKVISLGEVYYEGEAALLSAKTELGEVTVLNHHRPFITVLVPGSIRVKDVVGVEKNFVVRGGFLHMDGNNRLTVLVD